MVLSNGTTHLDLHLKVFFFSSYYGEWIEEMHINRPSQKAIQKKKNDDETQLGSGQEK